MRWKVGDLCVAKTTQFGWANCEVKQLKEDVATVESLEYGDGENINISELKQFGPSTVNKEGELIESGGCVDAGVYGGWKAGDACVAQWTQDDAWYNSQILHFFNEKEILVRFMDYGNADFTTLGNLKPAGSPTGNVLSQSPESPLPPPKHESKAEQLSPRSMKRVSFDLEEKSPEEDKTRCWRVGDSCVAQWSEDGGWYRSKILAIQGEEVSVVFTDYGNECVTALEQLKPVDKLEKREGWKVGDLCVAMWSEDLVWYNSQIIEINGERVLVKFLQYGNEDFTTLEQLKPPGSIEETLVKAKEDKWEVGDLCVAQWNEDKVWYDSQIVKIDGDKVLVRFVEYGNEDFTTMDQLKPAGSLVSQDGEEKTWTVGDLCVARWEEDQVWYNSKIIKIDGEKALVKFVDYGNEDFASLSQLKPPGSLELEDSPPLIEKQRGISKLEDSNFKVDDFCIAKSVKFDQMYNGQILKIIEGKALIYYVEFSEQEELPLSALLPFGPYAINKEQKLVEFKDCEDVCVESINGWKDGDECMAKWAQDDCWYHSKIRKIFSETEVLVQFIKFGNADFAAISELKPLDSSSEEVVTENEGNKIKSKSEMSQHIQKEIPSIQKQADRDPEKNVESVQADVKQIKSNQDRNNEEERGSDKRAEETRNSIFNVTHQEMNSMIKNEKGTDDNNEAPEDKLKKTVARSAPLRDCKGVGKRWKVGDLCVAKWREDGVWYNSKILGIDNNKVNVLFVEYGNQDYTVMEELKPPGSLDTNGTLKEIDSGQFSDFEETDDHRNIDWKVGDVCREQLNVDQSWFKCKILEINFGQALVEFLDYGSQHYCSVHSLVSLSLENCIQNVEEKKSGNENVNIDDKIDIAEKGDCNNFFNTSINSKERAEADKLENIEYKKLGKPAKTQRNDPDSSSPLNENIAMIDSSRSLIPMNKLFPSNSLTKDGTQATWKVGDKAAAYWESDGRWRHAIIQQLAEDEAFVICPDEDMVKGTQVNINSLKHKSVPTEALNLVDEEIKEKSRVKVFQQEGNTVLDTSSRNKINTEKNRKFDVSLEYPNEEIGVNISTGSQSSPENSENYGVLFTLSDLMEQSPNPDQNYSKLDIVKSNLSDYKKRPGIDGLDVGVAIVNEEVGEENGEFGEMEGSAGEFMQVVDKKGRPPKGGRDDKRPDARPLGSKIMGGHINSQDRMLNDKNVSKSAFDRRQSKLPPEGDKMGVFQVEESTLPDYKAAESTDYKVAESTDYKAAESTDYKAAESTDYKAAESTDYKAAESTDYKAAESTDYKAAESTDYKAAESTLSYCKAMESTLSVNKTMESTLSNYKAGTSIEDYRGRMLGLAMTESGSRYLQSVIPGLTQREIHNLQTELMANGVSAMNHPKATFVVQKLVEVADSRSMEMFVDSVTKHFSWVACHPAGSRVVQKCTLMSSPDLQTRIFTKIEDSRCLIMLAKNKYGTRVVQTCLPLMPAKIVKIIADSFLGHMVDLGRHPFATYFIQQLVALQVRHQVGSNLLVDEICQNIHLLAYDKFGTFLVQTLVSATSPSPVLQLVSSWTVFNLSSLYVSQPAVFLAISVFRRLAALATNSPPAPGEDWSKLMAEFVASLTEVEVEGRPLLITQAIHSQGHLLAKEVVLQMANIPDVTTKNRVLQTLAKYTIVLKADSFGCVVLKALHGLL